MKSSIRNEIKAQIIRAGYTMQKSLTFCMTNMAGATAYPIFPANCSGGRCGIGKPWSWLMCWDTMWFGRNGGNRMTDAEKKLLQAKHPHGGSPRRGIGSRSARPGHGG